ncbi:MAG: hypothetical protein C4297_11145 [Gemmataceae bacterium]
MKLSLIVTQGKAAGQEIPIRVAQFLIGRDSQCHLRPASPLVSKRHCAVLLREGKAFVRDFGSTNGTFVNGQQVQGEKELHNGDEIRVGPLVFKVKVEVTTDKPTPVPAGRLSKPQAKVSPAKTTSPPTGTADLDDESVIEMLLNLEGSPTPTAVGSDIVPGGSTIMDINKTPAPEETQKNVQEQTTPVPKGKPSKVTVPDPQATAQAAKAILEKYMRRPRTSQ